MVGCAGAVAALVADLVARDPDTLAIIGAIAGLFLLGRGAFIVARKQGPDG